MNILYLCEYPSLNGAEHSLLAAVGILVRRGISATILAPENGPFPQTLKRMRRRLGSTRFDVVPWCRSGKDDWSELSLEHKRERLADILEESRPDLVHANSLSMGRMSGPVLEALHVPGVSHLRDIVRLSRKAVEDLNRHEFLFAVSEATRNFHVLQGIQPKKCVTLYNGIDANVFRPRPATGFLHRRFGIPETALLLGTIGQIGPRKGQDLLLDALEPLMDRYDFHLLIVGSRFSTKEETRRYEEHLRDRANHAPFAGRVHFTGVRTDVHAIMNELALLVHCAREEPLGRVLLEATFSGTAVLASDVGGTAEILSDPNQRFPKNDVLSVHRKIEEFFRCPQDAKRRAEQTRIFVQRRFSLETSVSALRKHYAEIVSKRQT